jgi:hypothetical protein
MQGKYYASFPSLETLEKIPQNETPTFVIMCN